jgi:hypothetical protein
LLAREANATVRPFALIDGVVESPLARPPPSPTETSVARCWPASKTNALRIPVAPDEPRFVAVESNAMKRPLLETLGWALLPLGSTD